MGVFRKLRSYFFTGVVVVGPLVMTLYIGYALLEWVDLAIKPLVPEHLDPDVYLPVSIPGFGLLFSIVLLTLLGALTANILGTWFISFSERAIAKMPFVSSVYSTIKQIFKTLVVDRGESFSNVGLIQWPRRGVWSIVFIARTTNGEVGQKIGNDCITVFVPTTPNPTGGYLTFIPRKEVLILDMTLEEGAKLILSAGLLVPDYCGSARQLSK